MPTVECEPIGGSSSSDGERTRQSSNRSWCSRAWPPTRRRDRWQEAYGAPELCEGVGAAVPGASAGALPGDKDVEGLRPPDPKLGRLVGTAPG